MIPTSPPRRSPFPARRVLATEQRSSLSSSPPTPALRRLHPLTSSLMAPGSSSERLDSSSTVTRRVSPSLSPTSRPSTSSSSSLSFSCHRRRRRRRRRRSSSPSSSSPSSCWWCCVNHSGVRRVYSWNECRISTLRIVRLSCLPLFFRSCCQRTLFVHVYTRKHRLSYSISFYPPHTRVYMRICICVCVAGSHRQVTREVNGDRTESNGIERDLLWIDEKTGI